MLASPPPPPPISAPSLTSRLQTFSGIVVALLPTHSAAHRGFGEAAVALPPTHSAAHRASSHDHPSKAGEPPPPLPFPPPRPSQSRILFHRSAGFWDHIKSILLVCIVLA